MENRRIRTVGGSCLGGVLGGLIGVVVGGLIANASLEKNETGTLLDLLDICLGSFALAIGAGIGGIIGAITGSAIGAGVAAKGKREERSSPPGPMPDQPPPAAPPAEPSTETELAQLKERIAELEEQKRQQEGGYQRERPKDR